MKILTFLNVSNIDNIDTDSGYILQKMIAEELIKKGIEYIFVSPVKMNVQGINNIYFDFGSNKYEVRFRFDWETIKDIISQNLPDYIWINQPELTSNFRALIETLKLGTKIISYIHYFPFHLDNELIHFDVSLNHSSLCQPIIMSLLSGIIVADFVFIHSLFAKQMLISLLNYYNIKLPNKIFILPPPKEIFYAENSTNVKRINQIIYNHRLYEQYGTGEIISLIKNAKHHLDFTTVVTDILANRSQQRDILDKSVNKFREDFLKIDNTVIETDTSNKIKYKSLIYQSKIGLAPYRKNCTWSMSVIDCMQTGLPVVAPDFAWYKEIIPNELRYNNVNQAVDIFKNLFLDDQFWSYCSKMCIDKTEHLGVAGFADNMLEIILN